MALAFALLGCLLRLGWARLLGPLTPARRALWLQESCRRVLAAIGLHTRVEGTPPKRGLVVSNHLSYLDVAVLAAATQCAFVSKVEVRRWPFFGMTARAADTLFIDRSSRASAEATALAIAARLHREIPILLFPEGTSTDGSQLLRFHSTLFEPAIAAQVPVTAAALRYSGEGVTERDLCWSGDEGFLPNLWRVLATRNFAAVVTFGEPRVYYERRAAARAAQLEVAAMRQFRDCLAHTEEMHAGN